MHIKATSNFQAILNAYQSGKDGILLEGGSRSGKTWACCQFFCYILLTESGNVITLGRDFLKVFKDTVHLDMKKVLPTFGIFQGINGNMVLDYNSNHVRCVGFKDDPMKVHGLTQDIFWINEGMNISKDTVDQLQQRTSKFYIIDYNPSEEEHFLYNLSNLENVAFHKTTVLDNPFAPEMAKRKILSYEPTPENIELGTADSYKWKVYGLGLRAADESVIFKNWQEFREAPKGYDWKIYGGDFGFSNDPSAFVEIIKDGHNLYVTELLYESWLTNSDIAKRVESYNDQYQVWDSSEPKSIKELRIEGINAIPAVKGPDSIGHGIQRIKGFNLFVNEKSFNLQKELRNYKWAKNKDGTFLKDSKGRNIATDKNNHLIDALRYGLTKFANA